MARSSWSTEPTTAMRAIEAANPDRLGDVLQPRPGESPVGELDLGIVGVQPDRASHRRTLRGLWHVRLDLGVPIDGGVQTVEITG